MVVFVERTSESRGWHGDNPEAIVHSATSPPDLQESLATLPGETVPKARRMALLRHLVAAEILPRLARARQAEPGNSQVGDASSVTTFIDTGELVRLLLADDLSDGFAFIESLVARGVTPEALYTGILPDAARWLGLMWDEDRCDFAQVTVALGRLQQMARMLSPEFQAASVSRADGYSLLLLPAPGEQHSFGLLILAEFFQRAGWRVAGGPKSSGVDAPDLVRRNRFDVVGFSIGSEAMLDGLAKTIGLVRRASRNRCLGVLVGGPLLQQRPDLAALAGADASAVDAPTAILIARDLATMRVAAE
jgi:MerR family transcriptional regulator, light-induced transcriptional regulator